MPSHVHEGSPPGRVAGVSASMFSVVISSGLSGSGGQCSVGCNVSVWPESMWEQEPSRCFCCHGTPPQNRCGGCPGHRSQHPGTGFNPGGVSPCWTGQSSSGLLVEICLAWTQKSHLKLCSSLLPNYSPRVSLHMFMFPSPKTPYPNNEPLKV